MNDETELSFRPAEAVRAVDVYDVPQPETPVDVHLDGNEGTYPPEEFVEGLEAPSGSAIRNYPDRSELVGAIAGRAGVPEDHLLVTAGADEAILRVCRAALEPGREMVFPRPTFSMLPRFGALVGAEMRPVDWRDGAFPIERMEEEIGESTGLVVAVSPNNPNGLVAARDRLRELAEASGEALTLVDHAYVEFCGEDATGLALERDDVVVTRTLSKAWGMAGLRIGYAVADPSVVEFLERAGNPYPVSAASMPVAVRRLKSEAEDVELFIDRIGEEREKLEDQLEGYGVDTTDSRANFVFGRFGDAEWVQEAFAGLGIAVRAFSDAPGLEDGLRITCPGDAETFDELRSAVATIFEPEALFLDVDGVLADVSGSYRQAIIQTAEEFGLTLTEEDVSRAKSEGDANNDWVLTQRLLEEAGIEADYDAIKSTYETRYQGGEDHRGLWRNEEMIHPLAQIEALAELLPVGAVTGRPRRDADRFFEHTGLDELLDAAVVMEDAEQKPSPEPVELLAERMGVDRAWMVGDTPDDARAARAAQTVDVLPLGMIGPGEDESVMRPALLEAGCGRILENISELERLIPVN